MQATRYRLRFVTGVTLAAATYGSATYGADTYGTEATDPLSSLHHQLVPIPNGGLGDPSWIYRQGDTLPALAAKVFDETAPIQLDAVTAALLVLTPDDGRLDAPRIYDLTIDTGGVNGDQLTRQWQPHDLAVAGSYRLDVVLAYSSGRRMSVPVDDRHHFVVVSNDAYVPGPEFASRWDEARWDLARWS